MTEWGCQVFLYFFYTSLLLHPTSLMGLCLLSLALILCGSSSFWTWTLLGVEEFSGVTMVTLAAVLVVQLLWWWWLEEEEEEDGEGCWSWLLLTFLQLLLLPLVVDADELGGSNSFLGLLLVLLGHSQPLPLRSS